MMRMDGLALISQQVKFCSSTFSAWYSNGIYILKFLGYAVAPPPHLSWGQAKVLRLVLRMLPCQI